MLKLSVIVLSYNTKDLLASCLNSLGRVRGEVDFEVIVVDNGSNDGSAELVKKNFPWAKLIKNANNLGFSRGNNIARKVAQGEYVLFLNSDTEVREGTLHKTIKYLDKNKEVGALTCKIVLPSGELDKDARRSFPTPWVAFTHLSGLDKIFPESKTFARYWYGYKDDNQISDVDALEGAFFLSRRKILDDVGWFDEEYFLNGEDIDLSWKIKEKGWKIVYYPEVSILHIKKGSKRIRNLKNVLAQVDAMQLFYKKHLSSIYPYYVNIAVFTGIAFLKLIRTTKYLILRS